MTAVAGLVAVVAFVACLWLACHTTSFTRRRHLPIVVAMQTKREAGVNVNDIDARVSQGLGERSPSAKAADGGGVVSGVSSLDLVSARRELGLEVESERWRRRWMLEVETGQISEVDKSSGVCD